MADVHHAPTLPRAAADTSTTASTTNGRTRQSHETGETSLSGSLRQTTPSTDRTLEGGAGASDTSAPNSSPADHHRHASEHVGREIRSRRKGRQPSSSAFLLQDALLGARDEGTRRRSKSTLQTKGRALPRTPERPRSEAAFDSNHSGGSRDASSRNSLSPPSGREPAIRIAAPDATVDAEEAKPSPPNQRSSSLDIDSRQIVNMALNLSESRRIASRRSVSRSNPPKLAPLPDLASGSNLKQHLQQQRKNSRTGSPKLNQGASPRLLSGQRTNSGIQSSLDPTPEYRYQFSASTLSRARKAQEHLELMSLYRQLLDYVPPLKPSEAQGPESPPSSPTSGIRNTMFGSKSPAKAQGRPYNPLQYIRNRKVRARERKVIDGDQQGFADVEAVRTWVDKLGQSSVSDNKSVDEDTFSMPRFDSAEEADGQVATDPVKATLRMRRPRVDWFFDPCDMIADAYWLEQGHHKQLIEDRHLRKIFPAKADVSQSVTRADEEANPVTTPWSMKTMDTDGMTPGSQELRFPQMDADLYQERKRARAKQKLNDIKSFHHRHNSLPHTHDFLRMRRDSFSDTSGSESETKNDAGRKYRPVRRETLTSSSNDLLEKQMIEALAQESRESRESKERALADVPETELEHQKTVESAAEQNPFATLPSRPHSRKVSIANISDSDPKSDAERGRVQTPSWQYRGRQSLEVPDDRGRISLDLDTSLQSSPQLHSVRDYGNIPPIGALSVTSSRSTSPSRNPLSKVKQKLLDSKHREHSGDSHSDLEDDGNQFSTIPELSPTIEKLATRPTDETFRSHKSSNSTRLRGDDLSVGLRGIFKGPRIDSVIRGGVSKLGDMLWKKDTPTEMLSEEELSAVESDSDVAKERVPQHDVKHFYDAMPQFQHVNDARPGSNNNTRLAAPALSRPQSRQSVRREMAKLPRLDIQSANLTPSPSIALPAKGGDTDASESESNQASMSEGMLTANQRLHSVMSKSSLDVRGRSTSRHWSITDRSRSPERTTLSKREIARMKTLILSSGIKAVEISRRAHEMQRPMSQTSIMKTKEDTKHNAGGVLWSEIIRLTPECKELHGQEVQACEVYPLASRVLGMTIQASGQRWQSSADRFTSVTSPELQKRTWALRSRIVDDLSQMTRQAADDSDEAAKNLALGEPLKVKHVVDMMEKLLRQRRRRFRWVRRALWLAVEWVLIGFMWYVWFMVMILRVAMSIGKGVWTGVKWLLWLH